MNTKNDIAQSLAVNVIGRDVRFFDSVTSTNDVAKELARDGAYDGTVVIAERQTKGRGRYERKWFSPPDSILMTAILRPEHKFAAQAATALGTVAVCSSIQAETRLNTQISWPNDVIVSGRKVAGVLAEASSCVLLGIGVNVNVPHAKFPKELKKTATSLIKELGKKVDRDRLLVSVIQELDALYTAVGAGQIDLLETEWRSLSATLGRQVIAAEDGMAYEGRAVEVSITKGLVLELSEGGTRTFSPERTSLVVQP